MAKFKIIYSFTAKESLKEILEYFNLRNGSTTYSKKLSKRIKEVIELLQESPELGIKVENFHNVRVLIKEKYKIFYELKTSTIEILQIWDCSRNPDKLDIYQNEEQ